MGSSESRKFAIERMGLGVVEELDLLFEPDYQKYTDLRDTAREALAAGKKVHASSASERAVRLARRISSRFPAHGAAMKALAESLLLAGEVALDTEELSESAALLEEAAAIGTELNDREAGSAWTAGGLAYTRRRQADVAHAKGDVKAERQFLEAALQVLTAVVDVASLDPANTQLLNDTNKVIATALSDQSMTLERLGILSEQEGLRDEARELFAKATSIDRRLVEHDPADERWSRMLVLGLKRFGSLERRRGDVTAARRLYEESLIHERRLAASNPVERRLAVRLETTLRTLGEIEQKEGRHDASIARLREAVAVRRGLTDAVRDNVESGERLVMMLDQLGIALERAERFSDALAAIQECLDVLQRLPEPEVGQWDGMRAHCWMRFGSLSLIMSDPSAAREAYHRALDFAEADSARAPLDARRAVRVASALLGIIDVAEAEKDDDEALRRLEEGCERFERVATSMPDNNPILDKCAAFNARLARRHQSALRSEEAHRRYSEVLRINRLLLDRDPSKTAWARNLIATLADLAVLTAFAGKREESIHLLAEYEDRVPMFLAAGPLLGDLSVCAWSMKDAGRAFRRLGLHEDSMRLLDGALNLHRKLVASQPGKKAYLRGLRNTLKHRGLTFKAMENAAGEQGCADEIRDIDLALEVTGT